MDPNVYMPSGDTYLTKPSIPERLSSSLTYDRRAPSSQQRLVTGWAIPSQTRAGGTLRGREQTTLPASLLLAQQARLKRSG